MKISITITYMILFLSLTSCSGASKNSARSNQNTQNDQINIRFDVAQQPTVSEIEASHTEYIKLGENCYGVPINGSDILSGPCGASNSFYTRDPSDAVHAQVIISDSIVVRRFASKTFSINSNKVSKSQFPILTFTDKPTAQISGEYKNLWTFSKLSAGNPIWNNNFIVGVLRKQDSQSGLELLGEHYLDIEDRATLIANDVSFTELAAIELASGDSYIDDNGSTLIAQAIDQSMPSSSQRKHWIIERNQSPQELRGFNPGSFLETYFNTIGQTEFFRIIDPASGNCAVASNGVEALQDCQIFGVQSWWRLEGESLVGTNLAFRGQGAEPSTVCISLDNSGLPYLNMEAVCDSSNPDQSWLLRGSSE